MYKNSTFLICLFISSALYSQKEYGLEYQHGFGKSYNSNSIGASLEKFNSGKGSLQIVFHYTWDVFYSEKKTQGISDFGVSFGYRYGFSYGNSGNLLGGIRTTFSHLFEKNHTKFTPSAEFGYHYTFNNFGKGGFATPSVAFGYDIPLGKEKDEDYEGTLFIPRLAIGYRF
jgi:hypothetical protein